MSEETTTDISVIKLPKSVDKAIKKAQNDQSSGEHVDIAKGICSLTPLGRFFVDVCIS